MASIKNQIVDFAISTSCLATVSGLPSGLSVRRGNLIATTAARVPEVSVYVGPEISWEPVGLRRHGNPVLRVFRLICEIRCAGAIPDEALDPIEVWVEKRLFNDETFGGKATGIVGWAVEQDARQSDGSYAMATVFCDIQYPTQRGLPETRSDS
jgi:hypothetical protein